MSEVPLPHYSLAKHSNSLRGRTGKGEGGGKPRQAARSRSSARGASDELTDCLGSLMALVAATRVRLEGRRAASDKQARMLASILDLLRGDWSQALGFRAEGTGERPGGRTRRKTRS